jgi:hypothetical protein
MEGASMPALETAVTPARFAQGLSYAEFLAKAPINHDKFAWSYEHPILTEDDKAFFRKVSALANGPKKLMVLAEAWCGDVYRELPTAVHIAELTGMELRIFVRDENPDIRDEFATNEGKTRAIPVFAFYTADTRYITHWTERSASAHAGLKIAMDEAKAVLGLPEDAKMGSLPDEQRQALLRELIARVEPPPPHWRTDAVKEIREALAQALSVPNAG